LVPAEVERTSALVSIQIQKEPALLRINNPPRKWPSLAGAITAGFFHFDHVGANISHQLRRISRRHHVPEFQHLYAFQSLHVTAPLRELLCILRWRKSPRIRSRRPRADATSRWRRSLGERAPSAPKPLVEDHYGTPTYTKSVIGYTPPRTVCTITRPSLVCRLRAT